MSDKLQRIAEIELNGRKFDVARNGHYRLVEEAGRDAYDNPIYREAIDTGWSLDECKNAIDGLVDLLGDALTRLQSQRDSRLGRGENGD